jgi:hypothetical protein
MQMATITTFPGPLKNTDAVPERGCEKKKIPKTFREAL